MRRGLRGCDMGAHDAAAATTPLLLSSNFEGGGTGRKEGRGDMTALAAGRVDHRVRKPWQHCIIYERSDRAAKTSKKVFKADGLFTTFDPYLRKTPIGEEIYTSFRNWSDGSMESRIAIALQARLARRPAPVRPRARCRTRNRSIAPLTFNSCVKILIHIRENLRSEESHPRQSQ